MLATMQLFLNLPNYLLQLVDEFSTLRATSTQFMEFYLYADALFYLLYLSQYPMLAVYVRWLHLNFTDDVGGKNRSGILNAAPVLGVSGDHRRRWTNLSKNYSTLTLLPTTSKKRSADELNFCELSSELESTSLMLPKRHSTGSARFLIS